MLEIPTQGFSGGLYGVDCCFHMPVCVRCSPCFPYLPCLPCLPCFPCLPPEGSKGSTCRERRGSRGSQPKSTKNRSKMHGKSTRDRRDLKLRHRRSTKTQPISVIPPKMTQKGTTSTLYLACTSRVQSRYKTTFAARGTPRPISETCHFMVVPA